MFARVLFAALLVVATEADNGPRVFSDDYVEGLYGRFFEFTYTGNSNPCPHVIDHFERGSPSALGDSWIVEHSNIVQSGINCDDGGSLVLSSYNASSVMPTVLESNEIAKQTFTLMKSDSTGFWMGADERKCGKWVFPKPSYVFFVREFDRTIKSFFNLSLGPGKKYMFIVSPVFTCIYRDIPRRKPTPTVVITNPDEHVPPSPGDQTPTPAGAGEAPDRDPNASGGVVASASPVPSGQTPGAATTENPSPVASPIVSAVGTGGDGSGGRPQPSGGAGTPDSDDNISIQDIQDGTSPPSASASPETSDSVSIQEMQSNEPTADQPSGISEPGEGDNESTADSEDGSDDSEADRGEAGESLCFPAAALVQLSNGAEVRMDELEIGDKVRVDSTSFSEVYMFTHRMREKMATFTRLRTTTNDIRLTNGHMLYANDRLVPAAAVKVGDVLRTGAGSRSTVIEVTTTVERGVYNPQTIHGDIVVDGIVTSTYTRSIEPVTAHSMLSPLRALWGATKEDHFSRFFESHLISRDALALFQRDTTIEAGRDL